MSLPQAMCSTTSQGSLTLERQVLVNLKSDRSPEKHTPRNALQQTNQRVAGIYELYGLYRQRRGGAGPALWAASGASNCRELSWPALSAKACRAAEAAPLTLPSAEYAW